MNLTREIHALETELRGTRGDIPCALAGRHVRDAECCSRVLAASEPDYRTCRACHHGQELARSSGWPVRNLPLLAELPAWARPVVKSVPVKRAPITAKRAPEPTRTAPARPKLKAAPVAAAPVLTVNAPAAPAAPAAPQGLAPRLAELARVLRELTADGRMRVSMLDLMRGLGASNHDEADALVIQAGLRTSRLYGPVQAVLVDFNVRQLLERAAASEVRQ